MQWSDKGTGKKTCVGSPVLNVTVLSVCVCVCVYTQGNFVSPSGICDLCGTVAGMVMPKGSMSTE